MTSLVFDRSRIVDDRSTRHRSTVFDLESITTLLKTHLMDGRSPAIRGTNTQRNLKRRQMNWELLSLAIIRY